MEKITFDTALKKIEDLKKDDLIPKDWAKIIAHKIGVTDVTIRDWAIGKKKRPTGAITVLKMLEALKTEAQKQIQNSNIAV